MALLIRYRWSSFRRTFNDDGPAGEPGASVHTSVAGDTGLTDCHRPSHQWQLRSATGVLDRESGAAGGTRSQPRQVRVPMDRLRDGFVADPKVLPDRCPADTKLPEDNGSRRDALVGRW